MKDRSLVRAFSLIAHVDHGKSTLADRILQVCNAVPEREMREQYLDRMDLERERGITIKAQAIRLQYPGRDGRTYELNLIDTPGHVDFSYEVSRSLAACDGVILLVDAAQGIEAQTLANLYLAIEAGLEVIPAVNKIDLPAADPERVSAELSSLIGVSPESVLRVSGKTGAGVVDLLEEVIRRVPSPKGAPEDPTRALIFDSTYDNYRGVVSFVRVAASSEELARKAALVQWLLAALGVAVSAYLTYLEAYVIQAWCQWCLLSAFIILIILSVATAERLRVRR